MSEQIVCRNEKCKVFEFGRRSTDWLCAAVQGFCYVKYSSPEIANVAIEHLNGVEFPQGSGLRLKVGICS